MAKKDDQATKANGQAKGTPANMPLFYSNPTPLDSQKHKNLALKKNFGFGYTRGVNAVPVNLIEMPQICHHYPIAFSPDANATPVAILGLRDQENLFVQKDNTWLEGTYIPAYIRRYPFIFSEMPDGDTLTLCIDLTDAATEENGEQALYNEDGKPSTIANNALEFCKSYHAAARQTVEFSKALSDAGLLIDREAQIQAAGNKRISFSGFKIVDEKKLAELDEKTFLQWREKGWLPFLYAHLFSGAQWQNLTRLLNAELEKEAA